MTLGDWLTQYLHRLRPELRASADDRRLQAAAREANQRGILPTEAAAAVDQANYQGARYPEKVAIIELERRTKLLAAHTGPPPAIGCAGCAYGWVDDPEGGPTRPCPTCRPQLAARLANIPPPGIRTNEHHHYLRHRRTMR